MSFLCSLRALVRVELRELRRHPSRALLVMGLVAIPVAALVGGSALQRTTAATHEELQSQSLGAADLRVDLRTAESPGGIRALLPGAQSALLEQGMVAVTAPGRRMRALFTQLSGPELEPAGLGHGLLLLREGSAPSSLGEVALSPVLLAGLGLAIGDEVDVETLGPRHVCGVIVDPEDLSTPRVLLHPGAALEPRSRALLLNVTDPTAAAARLEQAGYRIQAREPDPGSDGFEDLALFVIGGLGFVEAALMIAAAFAVGLRRRQRELGLLGSTGAPIAGMRIALLVSAALLAGLGSALGAMVGWLAALGLHPFLDDWTGRINGALEVAGLHLAGALLLGIGTSLVAASLPARSATRLPIRVALSGQRPVSSSSRLWIIGGLGTVAAGLALLILGGGSGSMLAGPSILGGSVLGVLGLGALAPGLLELLARGASRLPLAWRLAVRDAGRYRARNGPVVAAVLAGMSVSVLLASMVTSIEGFVGNRPPELRSDQLRVEGPAGEEVARLIAQRWPSQGVAPLMAAYAGDVRVTVVPAPEVAEGLPRGWLAVVDEQSLRALGLGPEVDALSGLELHGGEGPLALSTAPLELLGDVPVRSPRYGVHADSLSSLGLQAGAPPGSALSPWLVRVQTTVDKSLLGQAQDLAAEFPGTSVTAQVALGSPSPAFLRVVLLISFLTGLVVIAIATSLSSVESASDREVLRTVGATPAMMRAHLAVRSAYLALLGCVLAVPAGMIPAWGLFSIADAPLPFHMPWVELAWVLIAFPGLTYALTWLLAWRNPDPSAASRRERRAAQAISGPSRAA